MTEEELTDVIRQADDNEDGQIDPVEFREIAYNILGLDGKGNPRGPSSNGSPFDDADEAKRAKLRKESCGLMTTELPLVCSLANALSGIIMTYRFQDDMPRNKFEYLKSIAVRKVAETMTPYVLDLILGAKKKVTGQVKEGAEAALDTVEGVNMDQEIDGAVDEVKEVAARQRSEITRLLKTLVGILKEKMNESKNDFSQHPYFLEAKAHAKDFGGPHVDTILCGIEAMIEEKLENVGHEVDKVVAQYTDDIMDLVTDPDLVSKLKSGALLAKGAVQVAVEEELHKENLMHTKTEWPPKPPGPEKSLLKEHELYKPIVDLMVEKIEETITWGMQKFEDKIEDMVNKFVSTLESLLKLN